MKNMKKITIGLLGSVVNNGNMGCLALTYSLISLLERIANDNKITIEYLIFEIHPDNAKLKQLSNMLSIDENRICAIPEGRWAETPKIIRRFPENINAYKQIKKCSIVIDMTQGDSFTDIYGGARFYNYTRLKKLVEKLNIPLILGPQTYGPFTIQRHEIYARQVMENASLIATRDNQSKEYLESLGIRDVQLTTDLAFSLPFEAKNEISKKTKIGLNISGLLVKNKTEKTITDFSLRADYDVYIKKVIDFLRKNKTYEIHFIPHVIDDYKASLCFAESEEIIHKPFDNPIDVKSCIANMDVFIGSRMHATIAGYSAGVATIPVAYSRKFKGLFDGLDYPYVVDLQEMDTTEAIQLTQEYVIKYKEIAQKIHNDKSALDGLIKRNYEFFAKAIELAK